MSHIRPLHHNPRFLKSASGACLGWKSGSATTGKELHSPGPGSDGGRRTPGGEMGDEACSGHPLPATPAPDIGRTCGVQPVDVTFLADAPLARDLDETAFPQVYAKCRIQDRTLCWERASASPHCQLAATSGTDTDTDTGVDVVSCHHHTQSLRRDAYKVNHLPDHAATSTSTAAENVPGRPWLVLKFGGTSVGKFLDNIAEPIVKSLLETNRVAVVCSARSTYTKAQGTTNRLLRAATEALVPGSKDYLTLVDEIAQDHVEAARFLVRDLALFTEAEEHIRDECQKLKRFLGAAEIIDEISPRSRDMVVSVGEKLSCRLVAAVLADRGVRSKYVSLEDIVQRRFDEKALDQSFYDYLSKEIGCKLERCGEKVPVVTGYFGNVPGSLLATVGRGYTDLAAALAAVGLGAEELQVWKEVDGIFTADPRKVPRARLLPIITPDEAAELTYYGSEVIHPFTMDQVIRAQIPIRIKNVQRPEGRGTVIFPDVSFPSRTTLVTCGDLTAEESGDEDDLKQGRSGSPSSSNAPKKKHAACASAPTSSAIPPKLRKVLSECGYSTNLTRRQPTAVTVKDSVIVLNVHSNRKSVSHGFLANIFSVLDRHGIVVDMISTSEVHVSMVIGLGDTGASGLKNVLSELSRLGMVGVLKDMAILSLVGRQMKSSVGIAGRMFTTLANAGINIEMISQGASEINISCVIEAHEASRALNAIHDSLLVIPDVNRAETAAEDHSVLQGEGGYWRGMSIEDIY